jgi:hypothetical protein
MWRVTAWPMPSRAQIPEVATRLVWVLISL